MVRAAGLLDRRLRYYAIKITVLALLLAAGGAVFALLGDSWPQLAVAVYLAALSGQLAFLGHEAGPQPHGCGSHAHPARSPNCMDATTT